jgi:2',3'-cyclic-nucleotide 2'-phosphodiesterase (5'-nucleotidase family)
MISFGGTKINAIYYNDIHGSIKNVSSFLEKREDFYNQNRENANFTLCGGDMFVDVNTNNDIVAKELGSKTDAVAVGNHDLEGGSNLVRLIKKFKMDKKFLSVNINYEKSTPLKSEISKSIILQNNGEKIGVIGISPLDFKNTTFINERTDFIKIDNLSNTISKVRKEVENLEKKNINKIFLLAHTGNLSKDGIDYYKEFAKIGGIDVIIGGHDHVETDRWETTERGEPVKITATGKSPQHHFGKNLDYYGELRLEFDKNGVLMKEKCDNVFKKLKPLKNLDEKPIRVLDVPLESSEPMTESSQTANLIADADLWYVNSHTNGDIADFALVNAGTIRDSFDWKEITETNVKCMLPFTTSTLIKAPLTKRQIINTLNWCNKSTKFNKIIPGLMHVSGMEYTIQPDLTTTDVHILDRDGSVKYNLDDFDDEDTFLAVYDVFLATGIAGLEELKIDCNLPYVECFKASRQDAMIEYLKDCPELFDYTTKRIKQGKAIPV